jgi:hypothetical protein
MLAFQVTSLPTNGTLFQYTASGRGSSISTPGTFLEDPSRLIFVPQPDAYGVAYDNFSFTATDGEDFAAPSLCTVSIIPPPVIEITGVSNNPRPAFSLTFAGLTNAGYSVWRSTSLGSWTYLGTASQGTSGQFSFTDNTISNFPAGLYRVRSP